MSKPDLKGSWAVITGASSGIGLEFTRQFAERGCNVLLISNQDEALRQAAAEVEATYGVQTSCLCVDLTARDAARRVDEAVEALPATPLVLVNDAGIFDFRTVASMTPERLDMYIDLHMRVVTQLCRLMGERMAKAGRGYILNMSSMSCWMPMPGITMYSATKAYIRVFSRSYRNEVWDRGVSVTVACPGGIATDLFGLPRNLQKLGVAVQALATPKGFVRKAINRTLRRRAQYINGPLNRLVILLCGMMPEWSRRLVKTQILRRYGHGC